MQETDMKEKLVKIIEAYDELQAKMGDPAVLADQKEYNRLAKEYASQGPLAKKAAEYVGAMDDLEAAKEMLSDADMKEFAQEEIAAMTFEASAGGGMVKATATGDGSITGIVIDPAAVDSEDVEMLQDMVTAAVNEALRSASEAANARMGAIMGGMKIPGLM